MNGQGQNVQLRLDLAPEDLVGILEGVVERALSKIIQMPRNEPAWGRRKTDRIQPVPYRRLNTAGALERHLQSVGREIGIDEAIAALQNDGVKLGSRSGGEYRILAVVIGRNTGRFYRNGDIIGLRTWLRPIAA